jgi:hypothetical protein
MTKFDWVAVVTVGMIALTPGRAHADDTPSTRITAGGTLGIGPQGVMAGAELGFALRPWAVIVGSFADFRFAGCDAATAHFFAAGVRLRGPHVFLDAQLGALQLDSAVAGGLFEFGVNLVEDPRIRLDLHLSILLVTDGRAADAVPMAGPGLHVDF